jgi:long-chain-fatty-acid--CoA ligase ACSBG
LKAIVQYLGTPTKEGVLSWKELLEIGEKEDETELEDRLKKVAINQCCHLVPTL